MGRPGQGRIFGERKPHPLVGRQIDLEGRPVRARDLLLGRPPDGHAETPSQIEEHIRTYRGLADQWNETIKGGRWSSERTEWKARRDECLRTLTEFEASLAQPRKTVYQLHSKRHVVQFSEEDYTKHLMTQATSPVWVSTWDGKRWRWYLDRFWWDSEDRTW